MIPEGMDENRIPNSGEGGEKKIISKQEITAPARTEKLLSFRNADFSQ